MNYIRNAKFQIKSGKTAEFNTLLTKDVLPMLRKHEGFKHELAMVNGNTVVNLSVWQDKASAEKFQSTGYPEVLKKLTPVIESAPQVEGYDLASTTLTV